MTNNESQFDKWLNAIQKVGFPVVVAGILLFAAWKVADKLVNSHYQFLQTTAETMSKQAIALDKLSTLAEQSQKSQERTLNSQDKIIDILETQQDQIKKANNDK